MANFIAPLPSAFNHEAKDPLSEFRYWRQCFTDFCEINNITDGQTLIKFFRCCVGRPTVTYLEDLPNYDQLTSVKPLIDIVDNRYKKIVNVHAERLNFRSIGINPGESLLDYESRLNSFSKSCAFQNYDRDSTHLEMLCAWHDDVHIKHEKCVFLTKEISYLGFKLQTKVYSKLMKT